MFECLNYKNKEDINIENCDKCIMCNSMTEDEILNNVISFFKRGDFLESNKDNTYLWNNYNDIKDKINDKDYHIYSLILCNRHIAFILKDVYKDNAVGYFISKTEVPIDECGLRYW